MSSSAGFSSLRLWFEAPFRRSKLLRRNCEPEQTHSISKADRRWLWPGLRLERYGKPAIVARSVLVKGNGTEDLRMILLLLGGPFSQANRLAARAKKPQLDLKLLHVRPTTLSTAPRKVASFACRSILKSFTSPPNDTTGWLSLCKAPESSLNALNYSPQAPEQDYCTSKDHDNLQDSGRALVFTKSTHKLIKTPSRFSRLCFWPPYSLPPIILSRHASSTETTRIPFTDIPHDTRPY